MKEKEITLKQVEKLFDFLKGDMPDHMRISRGHMPKLTHKQAFTIIWYLQEELNILPDHYDKCWSCGELFDAYREGLYWQSKCRHYCGACEYLVPENYDRGKH